MRVCEVRASRSEKLLHPKKSETLKRELIAELRERPDVARDLRFAEHDVDVAQHRRWVAKRAAVARQGVRLRVSSLVVPVLGAANRARGRPGRFRASVSHGSRRHALREVVHHRQ